MTVNTPDEEELLSNVEEAAAVRSFLDLRCDCPADAYVAICRRRCRTEGVVFDRLRAIVWRDMVLGLGAAPPVPFLADTLILNRSPKNRGAGGGPGDPARLRGSSCQSHTPNERSAGSGSSCKGTSVRPPGRSASMPPASVPLRDCRYATSRPRSTSQIVKSPKMVSSGPSSLLSVNEDTASSPFFCLPSNCQIRVVEADIQRSLWLFYPQEEQRNQMRSKLKKTILRVLSNNPERHYYQGLHELIGFVMYVLSPHLSFEEIVSICQGVLRTRWRAFSEKKLLHSQALLYAMHAVIAEKDPSLAMALERCGVGPESHYAVSWVITWYAHSLSDLKILARLFDYFITDSDGMAVILFTSMFVLSQRERILKWIAEAPAEMIASGYDEADDITVMAKIYSQMVRMPSDVLDSMSMAELNKLVQQAAQLRENYLNVVYREQGNFINGKVCKLGFLSNQRTRNAALRLLWYLLPREWRNPVANRSLIQVMLLAGAAVFMVTAILCRSRSIELAEPL